MVSPLMFLLALNSGLVGGLAIDSFGHRDESKGPFTDDTGRICHEKIEMVEDIEYEEQIHCKVQMQKSCHFVNRQTEPEDQACHTMYHKECQTTYRPQMTKVNVQVCPNGLEEVVQEKVDNSDEPDKLNSVVMDVRPSLPGMVRSTDCIKGRRKVCLTKHETECNTEMVTHEMVEDHPNCKVEKIPKCGANSEKCYLVSAMRCKIEQRIVMKTKPETKCRRMPREFCHKEECMKVAEDNSTQSSNKENHNQQNCYFRQQIVNEVVPLESCKYRPERVCHPVSNSDRSTRSFGKNPGPRERVCEEVPIELCETKKMNPKRVMKPMRKKMCKDTNPNAIEQLLP